MSLTLLGWTAELEADFETFRAGDLEPARVVVDHGDLYIIRNASGEFAAGVSGKLRHEAAGRIDLPAIGDWVVAALPSDGGGRAVIHHVLPRRTVLLRKTAGRETAGQVLAANLDTVFLVSSMNRDFNKRRFERTLAVIRESGAQPVLILSKSDLSSETELFQIEAEKVAIGVPVHTMSGMTGEGTDKLGQYLQRGKTGALIGSSGVGKSTLVNRLVGREMLKVREIREDDARGRHATTHRQLVTLPDGGMLIDTPGLREIGLWENTGSIGGTFPDIEELSTGCRFHDCRHETEPGCAVKTAMDEGTLDAGRYESFMKLKRELAYLECRKDQRARSLAERKWKTIAKESRRINKERYK